MKRPNQRAPLCSFIPEKKRLATGNFPRANAFVSKVSLASCRRILRVGRKASKERDYGRERESTRAREAERKNQNCGGGSSSRRELAEIIFKEQCGGSRGDGNKEPFSLCLSSFFLLCVYIPFGSFSVSSLPRARARDANRFIVICARASLLSRTRKMRDSMWDFTFLPYRQVCNCLCLSAGEGR